MIESNNKEYECTFSLLELGKLGICEAREIGRLIYREAKKYYGDNLVGMALFELYVYNEKLFSRDMYSLFEDMFDSRMNIDYSLIYESINKNEGIVLYKNTEMFLIK